MLFPLPLYIEKMDFESLKRNRNDVMITSTLNRFLLDFNTINRTQVPTFSPSFIKIRPILSEIKAVKAGRDTHTHTKTHRDKVYRSHIPQTVAIIFPERGKMIGVGQFELRSVGLP